MCRHSTESVSDHVEEMADRGLAQSGLMVRLRHRVAALHDHSDFQTHFVGTTRTSAEFSVTMRTEYVESVLSAREQFAHTAIFECSRRNVGHELAVDLTREELIIVLKLPASDSTWHWKS